MSGSRHDVSRYIHGTAAEEQERLKALNALTNPAFLEFLQLLPGARVLEVGSGLGLLARDVALSSIPALVAGVELSAEQLEQAPPQTSPLTFVQADAHSLPFKGDSFDIAYTRYLLEHVYAPQTVLEEMRRVLVQGGSVYLQENNILINAFDPSCPTFDLVWKSFAGLQKELGGDAEIGKKLYRLLHDAGFEEIRLSIDPEIHHAGMSTYRPWIFNLLGNIRSAEVALVERGLVTRQQIEYAYEELRLLADNPRGSAYFHWNRATGRKPAA